MSREPTGWWFSFALLALLTLLASAASSGEPGKELDSLKRMSIEELLNVEITSVSRTEESLAGAAAAVSVVTNEDIRRLGATSVPEALRHLPGVFVARSYASAWAVSARGFSSVNSEKLLVLSDTRSIYTPLFAGVLWDVQNYLLEDIERIEVIRGPGATLWGSNAVNGVINITTRSARDTRGLYAEAGAGTEEEIIAAARYGASLGESGAFRIFGKYAEHDATLESHPDRSDDWRMGQVGFRADWELGTADTLTIQGDAYRGTIGQLEPAITITGRSGPTGLLRVRADGGNVLGRWRHSTGEDSDVQLRFYYDRTHRDDPSFRDDLDTFDLDLQHRLPRAGRHEVVWGLNYRLMDNDNRRGVIFALEPASSRDVLASGFIQDQVTMHDKLRLTVGTKLEHNDFSGFEVQPSVRLAWDIAEERTLWMAISRAVRVPTRLERDFAVDVTDPAGNPIVRLLGNEDFDAEELLAYELGFRWQLQPSLAVDLAAFYNRYEGLASLEFGAPFVSPVDGRFVVPILNENLTDGTATGFEALATFSPAEYWRLIASYSYLDTQLDPRGADLNRGEFLEGATPRHQWSLRSSLDLPQGVQLDAMFRSMSAVRSIPQIMSGDGIGGYSELDVRVAWRATQSLEIVLVGQNLLHDHHAEFGAPAARGEIERGVYGKVVFRY
jgi:iron complex outermembrane receptor protein